MQNDCRFQGKNDKSRDLGCIFVWKRHFLNKKHASKLLVGGNGSSFRLVRRLPQSVTLAVECATPELGGAFHMVHRMDWI